MKNRVTTVAGVLISIILWPYAAVAQSEDPKEALERGARLARQERFDEAISIWLGVLDKLEPEDQAAAMRKLGLAYKRTGRLPEAWHYLSEYVDSSFGTGDETAAGWLQEVEASLKQSHVKVTFSCHPEGLTLILPPSKSGGLGSSTVRTHGTEFAWWFAPGTHTVLAKRPGYESRSVQVDVHAGVGAARVEIALVARGPGKETGRGSEEGGRPGGGIVVSRPAEPEKPSRALEWTLIGSGLAMGAAGAIFYGLAYSRNEELDAEYSDARKYRDGSFAKTQYDIAFDDEVRPKEVTAKVLFGVGGAAILAGIVTYVIREPGKDHEKTSTLSVVPLTLSGGAGTLVTLEF